MCVCERMRAMDRLALPSAGDEGLVSRGIKHLYKEIESAALLFSFDVSVSVLEIYNEQVCLSGCVHCWGSPEFRFGRYLISWSQRVAECPCWSDLTLEMESFSCKVCGSCWSTSLLRM